MYYGSEFTAQAVRDDTKCGQLTFPTKTKPAFPYNGGTAHTGVSHDQATNHCCRPRIPLERLRGWAALADIVVDGHTMTFLIPGPDAEVKVTFEGEDFSGGMSDATTEAFLIGTKRKGA